MVEGTNATLIAAHSSGFALQRSAPYNSRTARLSSASESSGRTQPLEGSCARLNAHGTCAQTHTNSRGCSSPQRHGSPAATARLALLATLANLWTARRSNPFTIYYRDCPREVSTGIEIFSSFSYPSVLLAEPRTNTVAFGLATKELDAGVKGGEGVVSLPCPGLAEDGSPLPSPCPSYR